MYKKRMKLLALLMPTLFSFSIISANTNQSINENAKNINANLKKQLKDEIVNTSENINTKQYFRYDGKDFENDAQLNQYLARKHKIEKVITTSKIGEIIKDYEFKLLDEEKVYSVNINDYKLVYMNRYGQAVLDKQEALKSHNSEITVRPKYTYGFGSAQKWYDSPTEAQREPTGIKSSMYIYLNNKYFNVVKDRKALLSSLTSGYYVNKSKFTKINDQEKPVYGTKKYLRKEIQKRYESTWINHDLWEYIDFVPEYKVKIKPKDDTVLKINGEEVLEYDLNGRSNKKVNTNQILIDSKWESVSETTGVCATKEIFSQEFKDGKNNPILLSLTPKGGHWHCYSESANPSVKLDAIDTSKYEYNLYKTKQGKINKDSTEILYTFKYDGRIENKEDLQKHKRKFLYDKWFNNYFFDNEFLKSTSLSKENKYGVEKDHLYNLNNSSDFNSFLSVKESLEYFKNVEKPKLKREGSNFVIKGVTFTEEEIDQYLYLKRYSNYRKMYNYFDSDHLTSIDGSLLFSSKREAEQRKKYYDNGILNKRYFVYHLAESKPELSGETEEEAVDLFSKTLKLKSKYVHCDEIKSWKNDIKSFDSIISNGRYLVYRVINKKNYSKQKPSYFYYQSYDHAINSIRKSEQHKISIVNKYIKLYLYKDKNNNSHLFTYKDDKQIDEIIDKIINLN